MNAQLERDGLPADLLALAPALRRYVRRRVKQCDVDDLVQEVWLRAHRGAASVHVRAAIAPWLFRIARNVVTDYYRAGSTEPASHGPELGTAFPENVGGVEGADHGNEGFRRELLRCMHLFLNQLSSEDRDVIVTTDLEGLTQAELAKCFGLSASGAKSKVQRARHKLRAVFDACCVFEFDCRGNVVSCREREDDRADAGARFARVPI
jgi:RNA polymerase sigma-70 factor (ECF subfamily)